MPIVGNYLLGAQMSATLVLAFTSCVTVGMGITAFTPGVVPKRTPCNHGSFVMHSVVQESEARSSAEDNFSKTLQLPDRLPTLGALENRNFVIEEKEDTNMDVWGKIIPEQEHKPWWSRGNHISKPHILDITTVWQSPCEGAEEMLENIDLKAPLSTIEYLRAKDQLRESFSTFKELYERGGTNDGSATMYKSRIVATRGTSGTKCPRYHSDWVPLRLICALKGSGVVLVDDKMVNNSLWRDTINQSDEVDSLKFNKCVEGQLPANAIHHGKCGANVLLRGKAWENVETGIQAAVHRSPYMDEDEGRVLLTVDVVDY